MRICRHWRKSLGSKAEEAESLNAARSAFFAEASLIYRLYAPVGSITGSLYDDAIFYMGWALDSADEERFEWGRYSGELTTKELSSGKKRSDYGWLFETLRAMDSDQVEKCFGKTGQDFLEVCLRTFARRLQRKRVHINNPKKQKTGSSGKERRDRDRMAMPPLGNLCTSSAFPV